MLAHVPGLKVALLARLHDAYAVLRSGAADVDPCIPMEARGLYQVKGPVEMSEGAEPIGRARMSARRCASARPRPGSLDRPRGGERA
jgi:2-oxoisovalerate dehydrogenase E1 component